MTRFARYFLILVLVLAFGCSESEEQDAAELNSIARELIPSDLSQAKVYAFSALEVAEDKANQYESYFLLGYIENKLGNTGVAISHYMEAIELYPEDEKSMLARKNLGRIFQQLGNYNLAIFHYLQAFEYAVDENRIEFLILLGRSYMNLGDLNVAQEYFHQAISESRNGNYTKWVAVSLNLEGLRSRKAGDLERARKYYLEVIEMKEDPSLQRRIGIAYHNLGDSYLVEGDIEKAIQYLELALPYRKKNSALFLTNMDLGECHLKLGDLKRAEVYLNKAGELYSSITPSPDKIKIFQHLTNLNQALGNKDKALEYSNKFSSETTNYFQTRDEYLQATSIAAVKSYAHLYEAGLSNKRVIKKTVYSIWAIALGGVFSLALMIFLWFRYVRRRSRMKIEFMKLVEGL